MSSVEKLLKALPDIFSFQANDYGRFVVKISVEEGMKQRWSAIGERLSSSIEKEQRMMWPSPTPEKVKGINSVQRARIDAYKQARKKAQKRAAEKNGTRLIKEEIELLKHIEMKNNEKEETSKLSK